MSSTILSTVPVGIGRLVQASRMPFSNFARSNSSMPPPRFETIGVAVCAFSRVLNRFPHWRHWRRRRMPWSESRVSRTLDAPWPQ